MEGTFAAILSTSPAEGKANEAKRRAAAAVFICTVVYSSTSLLRSLAANPNYCYFSPSFS